MNIELNDPRPRDRQKWIDKVRKVAPFQFEEQSKSRTNYRKSEDITAGLEPYTGTWGDAQIMHLLRRTLFGVKKSDLDMFKNLEINNSVSQLLTASPFPAPPINNYNGIEDIEDPDVAFGETWITSPFNEEMEGFKIISLKAWLLKNIINQEPTLHEKMHLFWHNLLVTQSFAIFTGKTSYQYFDILRKNTFGNFKTLIKEITKSPAMLLYLNGAFNHKEAPDENYGRELQELFCIGKGEGSNYTENDVQTMARLLTGWTIDWDTLENEGAPTSFFNEEWHDTDDKQFSSFYGNTLITGKSGSAGEGELDEMLDMIFANNEVALYICRRLYNFFVYSEIDAATEQNVIVPLAEIFRNNDYEIMPVLEALFKSAHFHHDLNHGALIKNPIDHTFGIWRTFEMQELDESNLNLSLITYLNLHWTMSGIGLEIADPPSVAGWPAYYQSPQFDKSWITTNTITKRASLSDALTNYGFYIADDVDITADLLQFVESLDNSEEPSLMLREVATLLLGFDVSDEVINNLKEILLSGQTTDAYWTIAWGDYIFDKSNEEYKSIVLTRLESTFQTMFQLAEFQLL